MISAFGVEHIVSKSYVNGKWVKAVELGGKERKAMGGYKKARGVSRSDRLFMASNKKTKKQVDLPKKRVKTTEGPGGTTHYYEHGPKSTFLPPGAGGVTFREGGKKGISHVHVPKKAVGGLKAGHVMRHEEAHARVGRTGYRMSQIVNSPKKLMREEGRADFEGSGKHFTKNPKQSGYAQAASARLAHQKVNRATTRTQGRLKRVPFIGNRASAAVASNPVKRAAKINSRSHQFGLSATLGKPVGNKEVDSYINVQNQMRAAQKRKR
jgi:hypothetical protein